MNLSCSSERLKYLSFSSFLFEEIFLWISRGEKDVQVMEDERKDKEKHVTNSDYSRTQLKVLIVDDVRVIRMTHKMLLDRVGVKDHVAVENGKEAVELHNNGQSFDLILMDKDMPVMNGIEVRKH